MKNFAFAALIGLFLATPAWAWDECRFDTPGQETVSAAGIKRVNVDARAGKLEIVGVERASTLILDTVACATREKLLEEVSWSIEQRDQELFVTASLPETGDNEYARLDLSLAVPAGIDIDLRDSSGSIDIRRVGALRVRDSSGSITIVDADGPVLVRDNSGSITLRRVKGNVDIDDGSGSIEVDEVEGSVRIEDGSGGMEVTNVRGTVVVSRDGSGSITVADVGGDFIVRRDGSGGISHERVAGSVRLPD